MMKGSLFMQRIFLLGLGIFFTFPALAQQVDKSLPQPVNAAAPTSTVVKLKQPATPTATAPIAASAPVTAAEPLEDIGYDPKVKRDPYGKVLTSTKGVANGTGHAINDTKLRNDVGSMRSDTALKMAPVALKPAPSPTAAMSGNSGNTGAGVPVTHTGPASMSNGSAINRSTATPSTVNH